MLEGASAHQRSWAALDATNLTERLEVEHGKCQMMVRTIPLENSENTKPVDTLDTDS